MTGSGWLDTLLVLLAVGVPVTVVWWFVRKPVERGAVPRDVLAARGKASAAGPGLIVWPSTAYRKTLVDVADDADHDPDPGEADAEPDDCDTSDYEDTAEHRAQVVRELRSGR